MLVVFYSTLYTLKEKNLSLIINTLKLFTYLYISRFISFLFVLIDYSIPYIVETYLYLFK